MIIRAYPRVGTSKSSVELGNRPSTLSTHLENGPNSKSKMACQDPPFYHPTLLIRLRVFRGLYHNMLPLFRKTTTLETPVMKDLHKTVIPVLPVLC